MSDHDPAQQRLESAASTKAYAEENYGSRPEDWADASVGSWHSNYNEILDILWVVLESRLLIISKREALGLIAMLSGEPDSVQDALTLPSPTEIEDFKNLDSTIQGLSGEKLKSVSCKVMNEMLAQFSPSFRNTSLSINQTDESWTKFPIGGHTVTMSIKFGSPEQMLVNFAHEIAHVKQRASNPNKMQMAKDRMLLGGMLTLRLFETNLEDELEQIVYRRSILERDADSFAKAIVERLDVDRYQGALQSELLSN